jgi:hypothetical protein
MTFKLLTTGISLFLSCIATAQNFEPPALPTTKEEFIKSEPDIIAAAKWLEATPLGTQKEKTLQVNTYVMSWITNSPTVNVELDANLINDLVEKNTQLMMVFIANYTRYCLENNYSKDKLKATTAGIKSIINCYALGGDTKKNKTLAKAIDADKESKLEDWVKEKFKSK